MKPDGRKLLALFFAFSMFLTASCKNQNSMKIEDVPIPQGAYKSDFSGDYKDALLNRLTFIRQNLPNEYRLRDEEILFVSPETDWAEINNFYNGQTALQNWTPDEKLSGKRDDYQINVYKSSGAQAIAVALIETGNAERNDLRKFLAILLLEK